jgi:ComEC/Rec2-related protein
MVAERIGERAGRLADALAAQHRRQPLPAVVALLLAGIACGYRWGAWPAAACGASVCGAVWAVQRAGRPRLLPVTCYLLLVTFLLGWALAARDRDGRLEEARRFGELARSQTFVCRVGPEVVATPFRGRSAKYAFTAEAVRWEQRPDGPRPPGAVSVRHLPVSVTWFGPADAGDGAVPRPGEMWELRGKAKVKKKRGSGLLSLEINSGEGRARRLAAAGSASWRARVDRARRAAARRAAIGIERWGDIPVLNQAMLLGARRDMPPAMRRVFVDSGTIHVFAISGMHIVLVAAVLTLAVSMFGVPKTHWLPAVGPPLVFYTVLTGAQPSAVRACLMSLLYFLAPLIGRKPSGWAALAGTALIVHAVQPALIYSVGSVLSFACMAGLLAFCRPFSEAGRRLCRVGRLEERARQLRVSGEAARARRWELLAGAVKWTADSFAVSLAAFLASVPLTAYYFGRFTPGGLFANLVICPSSLFIVVAGLLGMAASCVSDGLASCFNHAAGAITWVMVKTAEVTAACPGANFRIGKWPLWMVWVWFGTLLAFAVWLRGRRRGGDGLEWMGNGSGSRQ